jgi:hypothetical protein
MVGGGIEGGGVVEAGIVAQIRQREFVLRDGIALLRLRSQRGEGRAGILLRLRRGVAGGITGRNGRELNRNKHGGEKQQPCNK